MLILFLHLGDNCKVLLNENLFTRRDKHANKQWTCIVYQVSLY